MASGMFDFGLCEIMRGNVDCINGDISAVLVSSAYSPALTSGQYQSEIPEASIIGEVKLTSGAFVGTAFIADPATFTKPVSGKTCAGAVIINDSGNSGTSQLIAYLAITPFTTDGSAITLSWNAGGIFEL